MSDWSLITEITISDERIGATAWSVEHLSNGEKMMRMLDAGVDQFGGEHESEVLADLVHQGALSETRRTLPSAVSNARSSSSSFSTTPSSMSMLHHGSWDMLISLRRLKISSTRPKPFLKTPTRHCHWQSSVTDES